MCACRGTAGFAHVSCLAEQAKILVAEAEENNLTTRCLMRGSSGGTSAACASNGTTASCRVRLGGRAGRRRGSAGDGRGSRLKALGLLGNGLSQTNQNADASVREALLATPLRLAHQKPTCSSRRAILRARIESLDGREGLKHASKCILWAEAQRRGRPRDYHSSPQHARPLATALQEAGLLRKIIRVTPRILGETHEITLRMRWIYANVLYMDTSATPDDLREAVTKLEDTARTAQRVFGRAHPMVVELERSLRGSREALSARGGNG